MFKLVKTLFKHRSTKKKDSFPPTGFMVSLEHGDGFNAKRDSKEPHFDANTSLSLHSTLDSSLNSSLNSSLGSHLNQQFSHSETHPSDDHSNSTLSPFLDATQTHPNFSNSVLAQIDHEWQLEQAAYARSKVERDLLIDANARVNFEQDLFARIKERLRHEARAEKLSKQRIQSEQLTQKILEQRVKAETLEIEQQRLRIASDEELQLTLAKNQELHQQIQAFQQEKIRLSEELSLIEKKRLAEETLQQTQYQLEQEQNEVQCLQINKAIAEKKNKQQEIQNKLLEQQLQQQQQEQALQLQTQQQQELIALEQVNQQQQLQIKAQFQALLQGEQQLALIINERIEHQSKSAVVMAERYQAEMELFEACLKRVEFEREEARLAQQQVNQESALRQRVIQQQELESEQLSLVHQRLNWIVQAEQEIKERLIQEQNNAVLIQQKNQLEEQAKIKELRRLESAQALLAIETQNAALAKQAEQCAQEKLASLRASLAILKQHKHVQLEREMAEQTTRNVMAQSEELSALLSRDGRGGDVDNHLDANMDANVNAKLDDDHTDIAEQSRSADPIKPIDALEQMEQMEQMDQMDSKRSLPLSGITQVSPEQGIVSRSPIHAANDGFEHSSTQAVDMQQHDNAVMAMVLQQAQPHEIQFLQTPKPSWPARLGLAILSVGTFALLGNLVWQNYLSPDAQFNAKEQEKKSTQSTTIAAQEMNKPITGFNSVESETSRAGLFQPKLDTQLRDTITPEEKRKLQQRFE
jgi:myosin heavy subunit